MNLSLSIESEESANRRDDSSYTKCHRHRILTSSRPLLRALRTTFAQREFFEDPAFRRSEDIALYTDALHRAVRVAALR
jgi:hypothetical protein